MRWAWAQLAWAHLIRSLTFLRQLGRPSYYRNQSYCLQLKLEIDKPLRITLIHAFCLINKPFLFFQHIGMDGNHLVHHSVVVEQLRSLQQQCQRQKGAKLKRCTWQDLYRHICFQRKDQFPQILFWNHLQRIQRTTSSMASKSIIIQQLVVNLLEEQP